MKRLLAVDHTSMTATLEPGLRGPEAEALLAAEGLTLGHYPQSFEYASIGGFAATRSSGQSSAGYGRFDALVVGLRVATPRGELRLGSAPANAAGPDLRQLILGSEGAFGVITAVTVRVRRLPAEKVYEGWRWPSFAAGADAMRTLAQAGLLPTVIRLSDEAETAINLARPDAIGGEAAGGCLMITGYEGEPAAGRREAGRGHRACSTGLGGTALGEEPGAAWAQGRFDAPYLRDSLLDVGVLVETLETATFWSNREALYAGVKAALEQRSARATMVLCHISHVYETGCSLYFTVAAKEADDPLAQWLAAKAAASDAMIAAGATITHHHAVGTDHKPWLAAEIGDARRLGAARRQGRPRPDRRPQPGGADPVTPLLHVPGQPRLRRRRGARGRGAGRPAAARGRRDRRRHLLARPEGDGRRWSPPRSARGDVVVSVGGDGMLSSLAGLGRRPPAARSRWCPPGAATTSPGCSASPRTRPAWPSCCSRATRARWTWSRCTLPGARERAWWPARSTAASTPARARSSTGRTGCRGDPVPLRRAARPRDLPAGPLPGHGRRREREYDAANVVVANSGLLRQGHEDRARRVGRRRRCSTSSSSRPPPGWR